MKKEIGLTLIEVLIALAIISISVMAVIKAASQNISSTHYLQNKTIAMWLAQQVMNEARAGLIQRASSDNQKLTTEMLGQEWYWKIDENETANQKIKMLTVKVFTDETSKDEARPIISLDSYVYHE